MNADVIQTNYDALEAIAQKFGQEAESNTELNGRVQQAVQSLEQGGWEGQGANAFFAEMDQTINPALQRLIHALEEAQSVTLKIKQVIQQAEKEASAPFGGSYAPTGSGQSGTAAGNAASGGAQGTGGRTAGPGLSGSGQSSKTGSGGLSAEQELVRDGVLKAADTAHKGAGVLAALLPAGQRVTRIVESLGFRATGSTIGGLIAGMDAAERGVSTPAAVVDGLAAGAIDFSGVFSSGRTGIVSAVVGVVHGITSAISPEAGKYTAVAADVMPGQVAEKIAVGAIDTADALIRGDHQQLVKHHQQNLDGKYGEVIRGYAIGADAVGAWVTGDSRALNNLSDAAASGKLGPVAEFGDWLGGAAYDLFN
jgi:WXG100 family type VII secretion target